MSTEKSSLGAGFRKTDRRVQLNLNGFFVAFGTTVLRVVGLVTAHAASAGPARPRTRLPVDGKQRKLHRLTRLFPLEPGAHCGQAQSRADNV